MWKEGKSPDGQREKERVREGEADGVAREEQNSPRLPAKTTPASAFPPIVSSSPNHSATPAVWPSFVAPSTLHQRFSTRPGDEPAYRVLRPPVNRVCCTPASDSPSRRAGMKLHQNNEIRVMILDARDIPGKSPVRFFESDVSKARTIHS
jgi:hypothetical protein